MKYIFILFTLLFMIDANGQESLNYQKPPQEILDLVDVPLAPSVILSENKEVMVLLSRNTYKTIEELSEEELRLGGLRIDPKTNIGSRVVYYKNIQLKNIKNTNAEIVQVSGLPQNPRLTNFSWSPDQKKMALTNTTANGVEVWVLDIEKSSVKKLTEARANANLGSVINWFSNSEAMLVKMVSTDRKELINTKTEVPTGPIISENDGKKAQNRTYQDLLKSPSDEYNFEQLALSEIYKISLDGKREKWLGSALYSGLDFSPDGNYIMVTTIEKPFSYLVPYSKFPSKTTLYLKDGSFVQTVIEVPLIEDLPEGFMATRTGKRDFRWRNDKASTLYYVEALDGGDPKNEAPFRDEVFELEAPFNGTGKSILKTINRFSGITWATENIAIAYDYWWNTRNTKTYLFNPSNNQKVPKVLWDRNYQDKYSDPGNFVTKRNEMGSAVLHFSENKVFLMGAGFTENGQFPFVDSYDLETGKSTRLYQSAFTNKKEALSDYIPEKNELLVRIESPTEYPNYYSRNLKKNKLTQLTNFQNPFKSIQNVHKEVIKYTREDGLELSATLYLPVGYDLKKKEKMPMILWAYPAEFKDKASAAQSTQNPNEFTYPSYGSMIYWVTRGYVVLDDASFPIVGEGDKEPNDTFLKQLVANAKAAIDAVDKLGYIDRNRVACGGHSYGAFMVANLLTHSDLFAAGIARSGAYNRTLTPFGFQNEERNYWQAPDVYNTMSPFMNADKMKHALLLIHGEADNNSGTYPMQSERYFNALKGLGATSRLVILPKESHGYQSLESILHVLWEQDTWLEKYVKNRKP
jgi:dipeptidyl aminopeptidase/acylaminoacyl peptidase